MGDRYFRLFIIKHLFRDSESKCFCLSGEIDNNYFSVNVVDSEKNRHMIKDLLGECMTIVDKELDKSITTIWNKWELPADRPDEFVGFKTVEGKNYLLAPVFA